MGVGQVERSKLLDLKYTLKRLGIDSVMSFLCRFSRRKQAVEYRAADSRPREITCRSK